jgi:hypothetical protein
LVWANAGDIGSPFALRQHKSAGIRRDTTGRWAQDEPSIRGPDRATSLKSEKKVRPDRDAFLGASCADNPRHFNVTITQF